MTAIGARLDVASTDIVGTVLLALAEQPQDEQELVKKLWPRFRSAIATEPAITQMLEFFERKGLVERTSDAQGREIFTLTTEGQRVADKVADPA